MNGMTGRTSRGVCLSAFPIFYKNVLKRSEYVVFVVDFFVLFVANRSCCFELDYL